MKRKLVSWRGISLLTGDPIAVVGTGFSRKTRNRKTGDMVQWWIIPDGLETPLQAIASGADKAVCGDCALRDGRCYLEVGKAPQQVYKALKRGVYQPMELHTLANVCADRRHRAGAWGDPGAVPAHVWDAILSHASGWTGYTHQWQDMRLQRMRKYLMASVDSLEERTLAHSMGWRTFRVGTPERGELQCVNDTHGVQCVDCMLCSGNASHAKSITTKAHGNGAAKFAEVAI